MVKRNGNRPWPLLPPLDELESQPAPQEKSPSPAASPPAPPPTPQPDQEQLDEEALDLHTHGRSFLQIARKCGITKAEAHQRVRRGLAAWRQRQDDPELEQQRLVHGLESSLSLFQRHLREGKPNLRRSR